MKTVSLSGSSRENVGKKGAAELRKQGRIPAVLYGGQQQVHFSISENEAKKLVFTPNVYLIDLEVNGKKVKAIVQETQIHPVTDRILHIDFFEVVNTFSNKDVPTVYNNFKFSKVEAELEENILHLKYRAKDTNWNYYILRLQ